MSNVWVHPTPMTDARGPSTWRALIAAAVAGLALAWPVPASANPLVDAGVEAANDGRFDEALASFDEAWNGDELRREDLVDLLVCRSIVRFALRSREALDRDLEMLAFLAPEYTFSPVVPPQVRRRFEELRPPSTARSHLEVSLSLADDRVFGDASVSGIPEGLVRDLILHVREPSSPWQRVQGWRFELPVTRPRSVDWYAEVIGPGGVVLASEGDATTPHSALNPRAVADSPSVSATSPDDAQHSDHRRRRALLWGTGAGVTAGAVVATVLALTLRGSTGSTFVEGPVFR